MKISQVFPTKYVAAADLEGRDVTLTVKNVTLEEMLSHKDEKVKKPVVWFERATKGLVLNVTNAKVIAALHGDETTDWTGKRITIYATKVRAFGTMQDAIRVREHIPAQPKPVAQAVAVEEPTGIDDDEDVTDHSENPFDAA